MYHACAVRSQLRSMASACTAFREARQAADLETLCATLDSSQAEAVCDFVATVSFSHDVGPTTLDLIEFNVFRDDDRTMLNGAVFERLRRACRPLALIHYVRVQRLFAEHVHMWHHLVEQDEG